MLLEALSIGASLLGGLMQSNAADKASDAQATAAQQALHAQQRATQQAQQLYAPGVAAYQTGLNALTQRLGLPTQGVAPAQTKGGQFDPAAYLAANPDVLAEYNRLSPNNLKNNLGVSTPEQFAQWHYDQYGKFENRAGSPSQIVDTPAPQQQAQATGNALSPQSTYTPPSYTAPEFSFDINSFKDNPAYKFALEQGSGQVMANASATGALNSGAALKALQDRGQKTGYNFYANERDSAYNRFNQDRSFGRGVYESDRNYNTGRQDRQTDDLFRYLSVGQNALSSSANAALGQGAVEANTLENIGASTAGNALAQGNIWSNALNGVMGGVTGLLKKTPSGGSNTAWSPSWGGGS